MINKKYITNKREPFFEIARLYIKRESCVLDLGSGNGDFSNYFSRNDFYLFDGNSSTVLQLKKNHKNVYLGMLPDLPYNDEQFDVIHCSHVVEHLTPEVFYKALKEMDRCLKSNGYLIISAPLMWDGFYNDLSHIRPYPPSVFKNYLCSKLPRPRTRNLISNDYTLTQEVYRYFEVNPLQKLQNINKNIFVRIYLFIQRKLSKIGLKYYEKTGYTIVLHKK